MGLPAKPVTLSVEQIKDLNQKLSTMRHDINNHLSLILAAVELVKYKPDMVQRMMESLTKQPPKMSTVISTFSEEFQKTLGITRP
jgi:hypothetical protein